MDDNKHFVSIKTKIMLSTLVPVVISFSLICSVIFASLFNSLHETAEAELLQIGEKYTVDFGNKINSAVDYLSIVASMLELQVDKGIADREMLQKMVFNLFDDYGLIDGSSIYFEPDMYDGKDAEYAGSQYGTDLTGRICYYFYTDNGKTAYLPEALENEIEFDMPHYIEAKKANKPIYTEPEVYDIDGRDIPMFTLTYPVHDSSNAFIGAVTVDLFLDDIYTRIQNEKIYETGYIVITNDNNRIIYSPKFEDIGKTMDEAEFYYELPQDEEASIFFNSKSIINGRNTLSAVEAISIPQLERHFYVFAAAPIGEINARGFQLISVLIILSLVVTAGIALLLYYLIGRISAPIREITASANRIANGDIGEISDFVSAVKKTDSSDEVHTLFVAIQKMLSQIDGMQKLKLETIELQHKKEKAESAARAKNDFLAKMSHEIRTPMNAVMGMTELILRKDLPQDIYENASMIKSASNNLLSIINDILDFSKIESGKLEIIEGGYLLQSLINDVVNVIKIRLIDKPVQFVVNIDPAVPSSLIGDEIRIRQALTNLLSNAVKYTHEGRISLAVSGAVAENEVVLTIEVSDSGVGIKEEDIDKLFGEFAQIDVVSNREIEGTGLGLAITRNLLKLMGGDITVQSEYGKGSVFSITLPQKFNEYIPFASIDNKDEKSVLIYESRLIYRESIVQTLESLGVEYKNAENIPALFEDLENYSYVFVSSFAYGSVRPELSKLENPPRLVLLSDVTEASVPKTANVLQLPVHSLSIANILNDIHESYDEVSGVRSSFTAPEAKVLIVDDIMANLKVAEGLMLPYELQVTVCSSGKEAIELVRLNRYDIVFMDHMMPEMDGLEATRHIREMDVEHAKSMPLIALTANAVSGVREMFIQNGFNDFLAKPIETTKLDAILEKWIPKDKRRKITDKEQLNEKSGFVDLLRTVPELSVEKALSVVGGSDSTYERIVRLSVRLLPENIVRLNSLIDKDLSNYTIEVHGIKGVLNNMGAYRLGKKALELEELSKEGDWETCKILHAGFAHELTEFFESLNSLVDEAGILDKSEGDTELLRELLEKLGDAVDFCDSMSALEILSSVNEHTFGAEIDEMIREMTRALESFDFDLAGKWLAKAKSRISQLDKRGIFI